jgi:prepilin-type N-terminal cleavage/methylation domain-containing protein
MKKIVKKQGFTLVELMIAIGIIITLAALSINSLLRVRMTTNEAAAMKTLRTLQSAFISYRTVNSEYPYNLNILASEDPPYIDSALASGTRNGYNFMVDEAESDRFSLSASPVASGTTGNRIFYIDESGEITQEEGNSAITGEEGGAGPGN